MILKRLEYWTIVAFRAYLLRFAECPWLIPSEHSPIRQMNTHSEEVLGHLFVAFAKLAIETYILSRIG